MHQDLFIPTSRICSRSQLGISTKKPLTSLTLEATKAQLRSLVSLNSRQKKSSNKAGLEGGCYCNELKISAMTIDYQCFLILGMRHIATWHIADYAAFDFLSLP